MEKRHIVLMTGALLTLTSIALQKQAMPSQDWEDYKIKYSKTYDSETEDTYRHVIYNSNLEKIDIHNLDETATYKMGINHFTDMSIEEFQNTILMPVRKSIHLEDSSDDDDNSSEDDDSLPSVNWVAKGAVQIVKNQGYCGSCWAFSATAVCESYKYMEYGELGLFSEQQIVSCDKENGDGGCYGGLETKAMEFMARNGICTQESYPYHSGCGFALPCDMSTCEFDPFTISGYTSVYGAAALKRELQVKPISVAVDASNWSPYSQGVFSDCTHNLNHAVLATGYNEEYWIIKNSWSHWWGEDGFIRLKNGNTCGIADEPSFPYGASLKY